MSTKSNMKQKPRKTKLVPRTCVENEEEDKTKKQMPFIKIVDVKTMAGESFETPQSKSAIKTYLSRVLQAKVNANVATESETLQSHVTTPATGFSQFKIPDTQTSNIPFRISVDVEVEEFDDDDRLQIDESGFEDKEIKMEVDETDVENDKEKVSDDILNFQNVVIKKERISPDRETESAADNTEIQIYTPPYVVIKTEKEDIIINHTDNYVNSNENNINSNHNNVNTNQFHDNKVIGGVLTDLEASNKPNTINQYTVTETQILTVSEKILATSTNLADKILAIEARNIIGSIAKEPTSGDNMMENKIQYALDDWKNWTAGSQRPPPLLYKCYVCSRSWWYLSEFREHLRDHDEINIKVSVEETSVEECNIIAYTEMVPEILDLDPTGLCWRCEKDYSIHKLSNRQSECYYQCGVCLKLFYSCAALKSHEHTSPECLKPVGTFKCYICPNLSRIPGERKRHMRRQHAVRTDLPIPTSYKRCNDCGSKYFIYNMHNCRVRICGSQCNYCFRKFRHRLLSELHMGLGNPRFKCRICNLELARKCMELEHVLMHSTAFIFAYKCFTCEDLNVYLDEETGLQHRYIVHKQKIDKKRNYFNKVLVPISCILPNYESPANRLQQTASTVNGNPKPVLIQASMQSIPELLVPQVPAIKLEVIDNEQVEIKVEPEELIIEDDNFSDEEYEDDIIRLNYDQLYRDANRKQPKIYSCRKCEFQGLHRAYKEHLQTKCGRIATVIKEPKVYSCHKCNFQGHHSVYMEHLKTDCSKHVYINEEVYTCTKCDTTFDSIKRYLAHFSSHRYHYQQCPVCMMDYQSFSTLIIHFNSHIRQSYYKMYSIQSNDDASQKSNQISLCKTCSNEVPYNKRFVHWERHLILKDSDKSQVMIANMVVNDNGEDESNDGECIPSVNENNCALLSSEMLGQLIENLQCDKKRVRDCPQCYRSFTRNNDCKRHIIEHLLSDAYSKWRIYYSLQCQICGQKFKKADRYKRHMRDHGCLPIFQCDVCDKAFSDSSNFTKHKKVHNMKVLVCDLCNKKFQAKVSLEKHMVMHQKSKPISCDICVREFPTDTLYRRHMRTKHDNTLKRNYSCLICKERFYTCKEKWEHSWEVHKERKYKADCPQCGKSFRTYMALKKHGRSNMCVQREANSDNKDPDIKTKTYSFDNSVVVYVKLS